MTRDYQEVIRDHHVTVAERGGAVVAVIVLRVGGEHRLRRAGPAGCATGARMPSMVRCPRWRRLTEVPRRSPGGGRQVQSTKLLPR